MSSRDAHRTLSRPRGAPLAAVGVALVLIALFLVVGGAVESGRTLAFDLAAHRVAHEDIGSQLEGVMEAGPLLGTSTLLWAPLMAAWLLYRHRFPGALTVGVSEAGAFVLYAALKGLFHRVRSGDTPPHNVFGYLFPSGHTMASIVTFGLLGYLIGARYRGWARAGAMVVTVGIIAFVALSLVYLDTHYITDVIGGFLVGGAWLTLSIDLLRHVETAAGWRVRHGTIDVFRTSDSNMSGSDCWSGGRRTRQE